MKLYFPQVFYPMPKFLHNGIKWSQRSVLSKCPWVRYIGSTSGASKNTDSKPQPDLLKSEPLEYFQQASPPGFLLCDQIWRDRSELYTTTAMISKFLLGWRIPFLESLIQFLLFFWLFFLFFPYKLLPPSLRSTTYLLFLFWESYTESFSPITVIIARITCASYVVLGTMFCATFDVHDLTAAF